MPDQSLNELLTASNLVFIGMIEQVEASMVPAIRRNERTVVAQVQQVMKGPPSVSPAPGSRITIQLSPDLPPLDPGDQATFFTNGWIYGETLAVTEVGRTPIEDTSRGAGFGPAEPAPTIEAALA